MYPIVSGAAEGQKTIPSTDDFFATVNARMPKNLLRGFEDTFMMGSITTTKNEPFIVKDCLTWTRRVSGDFDF